ENERFKALDKKTSDVILYCSKLKIDFDAKEEEEFDMCKAFEDYKNLGKSEGFEEGVIIGESKGIEIGKSEGIEIGRNEGLTRFATYLIKNNVDINEIISQTGFSADEIIKIKNSMI
ncbi:MAG: hypothetical protein IJP18_07430, partial [Oscillospiraceae bacterium]|nr:hypothetical protein [Oscillospiraceae bacterium]